MVLLCELEGLRYEEAAEALGIPVGTVRSRLARARARLAALLADEPDHRLTCARRRDDRRPDR